MRAWLEVWVRIDISGRCMQSRQLYIERMDGWMWDAGVVAVCRVHAREGVQFEVFVYQVHAGCADML